MLRRGAAFCRPLRPVLLLVSFPRSRSPVVGVLGLCWTWRDVPFARQRRPVAGVPGVVLVVAGVQGVPPPPMVHGQSKTSPAGRGEGIMPTIPTACVSARVVPDKTDETHTSVIVEAGSRVFDGGPVLFVQFWVPK